MKKYLITLKNITFSMLVFFLLYEDASSEALDIFPIQNERVNYQGVVETASNYTDQQIFEAAKIFLNSNNLHRKFDAGYNTGFELIGGATTRSMATIEANSRNRTTFVSETPPKTIRVNLYQYFQGKGAGAVRTLYIDSDLKIDIKNSKYRYTLSNFNWTHWNHFSGVQMPIKFSKDCGVRGTLYQLHSLCTKATKSRKKAFILIHEDVNTFIEELKEFITSELNQPSSDDNW